MSKFEPLKYAIVDIETTGASGKITEVAVVQMDGTEIVGRWSTLVNPQELIPSQIVWLTGITQKMVENAPVFEEISDELEAQTADRIFVAHSVNFDYGIIKSHFTRLNQPFNRRRLCSVRLSRSIIPGMKSYSLGKLCDQLGIDLMNRHRALGDADATARLFQMLLAKDELGHIKNALNRQKGEEKLPTSFDRKHLEELPTQAGIYRFHDARNKVVYVGKANNIQSRIKGHFLEHSAFKAIFRENIHHITHELSGTEALALIMEAAEIKKHFPVFNKAAKYALNSFGLIRYESVSGQIHLGIVKKQRYLNLFGSFSSAMEGRAFMQHLVETYQLCPFRCGLQKLHTCPHCDTDEPCFGSPEDVDYNSRVLQALADYNLQDDACLYLLKGRNETEKAFVLVENGIYRGYGFIPTEFENEVESCYQQYLIPQKEYSEITRILSGNLFRAHIEQRRLLSARKLSSSDLPAWV